MPRTTPHAPDRSSGHGGPFPPPGKSQDNRQAGKKPARDVTPEGQKPGRAAEKAE